MWAQALLQNKKWAPIFYQIRILEEKSEFERNLGPTYYVFT